MADGPVVVLALTHRSPDLVRILMDGVLRGRDTAFVVHHDPESPRLDLPADDRVMYAPDPRHLRWGRDGLALAILDGIEFCRRQVPELSWILVVSGQDQLCRPMRDVESTLAASDADAMMRWFEVSAEPEPDEHQWQIQCRQRYLRRIRLPGSHRGIPFPRRSPFDDSTRLFIGDAWVNLRDSAVDRLLDQRRHLTRVERYLRRCTATDEGLLPTLLLNDARDLVVDNSTRRFMRWVPRTPHPSVLRSTDLPDVVASDAFFARKFGDAESARLLESTYAGPETAHG